MKKSKGYIWLSRKCLNDNNLEKQYFVGKSIYGYLRNHGFQGRKEMLENVRYNEKPLRKRDLFKCFKNNDRIEVVYTPKGGSDLGDFLFDAILVVVGTIVSFVPGGQAIGWNLIYAGITSATAKLLTPTPRQQEIENSKQKDARSQITGASNTISKSIIPVIFGKTKQTFFYGQNYYRNTGDGNSSNNLYQYVIAGYNNLTIDNLQLGDTPLSDFGTNVSVETKQDGTDIQLDNILVNYKEEQLTIDETTIIDEQYSETLAMGIGIANLTIKYSPLTNINFFSDKKININATLGDSINFEVTKDNITIIYKNKYDDMTGVSTPSGNNTYGGATSWQMFDNSMSNFETSTGYRLRNNIEKVDRAVLSMKAGTYDFDIVYTEDVLPTAGSDVSLLNYTILETKTGEVFTEAEKKTYDINVPITATAWGININGDVYYLNGETIDRYEYYINRTFNTGGSVLGTRSAVTLKNIEDTRKSSLEKQEFLTSNVSGEITLTIPMILDNDGFNKFEGDPVTIYDTSPKNTIDMNFVFSYPQGFYQQNNDATKTGKTSEQFILYKTKGSSSYLNLDTANAIYVKKIDGTKLYLINNGLGYYSNPNTTTAFNSNTGQVLMSSPSDNNVVDELFFRNIGIEVDSNQYTYNVRSNVFLGGKGSKDLGSVYLSEINCKVDGKAINPDILDKLTQIRLEATAYKKLSGSLQQFNGIVSSKIPNWNGLNWDTIEYTSNPASVIRYLITDSLANPRADSIDIIDNDSFVEFWQFCEDSGYYANGSITSGQKILSTIQSILDNCQATLTGYNGSLGISIDKEKNPTGMITPHNSWNLGLNYSIGRKTNALRFIYVDEEDYLEHELTLYYWSDGSIEETPEAGKTDLDYEIVKNTVDYTYNKQHVINVGKYKLKTTQERIVEAVFNVNLESLAFRLNDKVKLSDTSNTGRQFSGRIKSVIRDGSNFITGFNLYSSVDLPTPENGNYKIYIRSIEDFGDGTGQLKINSLEISNQDEKTNSISLLTPFDDGGIIKGQGKLLYVKSSGWYDGDLFDINDSRILDMTITDIKPTKDLTATITALETPTGFFN